MTSEPKTRRVNITMTPQQTLGVAHLQAARWGLLEPSEARKLGEATPMGLAVMTVIGCAVAAADPDLFDETVRNIKSAVNAEYGTEPRETEGDSQHE